MSAPTKAMSMGQALCILGVRAGVSERASEAFAVVQAELERRGEVESEAKLVVDDWRMTGEVNGLARLHARVYPQPPAKAGT
jgi:hypothetical protein